MTKTATREADRRLQLAEARLNWVIGWQAHGRTLDAAGDAFLGYRAEAAQALRQVRADIPPDSPLLRSVLALAYRHEKLRLTTEHHLHRWRKRHLPPLPATAEN